MMFLFSKVENSQEGDRERGREGKLDRGAMPPPGGGGGGGGSNGGASEVIMPRGYWGEPTATIDWCEKNYEVSQSGYP